MDGVRDVVGGIHDRRLGRLLPISDPPGKRLARLPQVLDLGRVRTELGRAAGRVVGRAAAPRGWGKPVRMRLGVRCSGPWVLEHCRAYGGGEVKADGGGATDLRARHDPVRLRVALEPVRQAETVPRKPVQYLLAEVPERRVPQVVRERGRLDHVRVAPAQLVQQVLAAVAGQPLGDRPRRPGRP